MYRIFLGLFLIILFIGCQKTTSDTTVVKLTVINDSTLTINGDTVNIMQLAKKLESFEKEIFILIDVKDKSLKMGAIHEIQRQIASANIKYTSNMSKEELLNPVSKNGL